MDVTLKNLLLFLSASIGFINEKRNFESVEYKILSACIEARKILERASSHISLEDEEANRLVNEIKSGEIEFNTIRKVDKLLNEKTLKKKEIVIKTGDRDIIAEHASQHTCTNCNRNKKRCLLRTSFKNVGVPPLHDNLEKCIYDNS